MLLCAAIGSVLPSSSSSYWYTKYLIQLLVGRIFYSFFRIITYFHYNGKSYEIYIFFFFLLFVSSVKFLLTVCLYKSYSHSHGSSSKNTTVKRTDTISQLRWRSWWLSITSNNGPFIEIFIGQIVCVRYSVPGLLNSVLITKGPKQPSPSGELNYFQWQRKLMDGHTAINIRLVCWAHVFSLAKWTET